MWQDQLRQRTLMFVHTNAILYYAKVKAGNWNKVNAFQGRVAYSINI